MFTLLMVLLLNDRIKDSYAASTQKEIKTHRMFKILYLVKERPLNLLYIIFVPNVDK